MPRYRGYPTSAEVLAEPALRFRPEVLRHVRAWKREWRGRRRTPQAIEALVGGLAAIYGKPVRVAFALYAADCYTPALRLITLNRSNLSVVTALHEFAHHAFGGSELMAARWSVHLFRRTFPRTFARCEFEGHVVRLRRAATE